MQVSKNKVVLMDYRLTDSEGRFIDSSEGDQPLAYLHGLGNIVAGLEKAMEGKRVGDEFQIALTPEEGYGHPSPELIRTVPMEMFEEPDDLEVGTHFSIPDEETGEEQFILISAIGPESVTIDGNHPLAGIDLVFDISVVEIRDATEEELEHGHAHDAGGCHHEQSDEEG